SIQSIAKTKYSFDPGGISKTDGDKDDRIVGRLDANLSETQRVSSTGSYTKDSSIVNTTTGNTNLGLSSNAYTKPNKSRAGISNWNADWSEKFSTEFRALYKAYDSGQFPSMGRTAQFAICADPNTPNRTGDPTKTNFSSSCPSGTPQYIIGSGGPSQSNVLQVRTWGGSISAKSRAGDHNFRSSGEWNHTKTFNSFVNPSAGSYYFDSIADFRNGNAQSFSYNNAGTSNPNDAAANFSYDTYAFGSQDDWRVNKMSSVTAGSRYDVYGTSSHPQLNPNFFTR
ncbi:hypothetical protein OY671_008390, partial [Metschnikowia pulcherrima]